MVELFANSGDPDQKPSFVASDLGLHCLSITLLGVSRLQWVKNRVANSVAPDKMAHYEPSHLDLHCLYNAS